MLEIYKDGFVFRKSRRENKKYDVFKNDDYITSFGGIKESGLPYQQYRDKLGLYSKYDHNDKKRRDRYYLRHGNAHKNTAKWFAHRYLW